MPPTGDESIGLWWGASHPQAYRHAIARDRRIEMQYLPDLRRTGVAVHRTLKFRHLRRAALRRGRLTSRRLSPSRRPKAKPAAAPQRDAVVRSGRATKAPTHTPR